MPRSLAPDDPRMRWYGAVSFERGVGERGDGWIKPWRIPFDQRALFGKLDPPDMLLSRAGMPSGVRLAFYTDSRTVAGALEPLTPDLFATEQAQTARIDLCIDGELHTSFPLLDRTRFAFEELPAGEKLVELWLPEYREIRLRAVELDDGARVRPCEDPRPRWLVYGSSNTQCRGAASPTATWPAIVARRCGLNLTNLGYGGECHLDSMVARMMRDLPAHFITLEIGINVYINATLNPRAFRAAVVGFVHTLRERHAATPLVVVSSFFSPGRETTPNAAGFTLEGIRAELAEAVETLRSLGDANLHYVDGLQLFGSDLADLLPDQLHPSPEGYHLIGDRFASIVVPEYFP